MKYFETKFKIGDIIEFKDQSYREGKWTYYETTSVDRISSITFNEPQKGDEHPIEIWCDNYSEGMSRMYVIPETVVRIIEKAGIGGTAIPNEPPIKIGQTVTFKEKEKTILDRISGHEVVLDKLGIEWRYRMEFSEYKMGADEFEVSK